MLAAQGALRDKIEGKLDVLVEAAKEDGLKFRQDAAADGNAAYWMLVGATALIVTGGVLIALAVARGISRPVVAITTIMSRLAAGDTGVVIPAIGNGGEIAVMARAMEVFKQGAIDNQRLNEAAAGNEQSVEDRRNSAMDLHTVEFGVAISGVMEMLVKSAGEMRVAARAMSKSALQTHQGTSSAVDGATTSSNNLASVAAAAERMATSVTEISKQVLHVTAAVRAGCWPDRRRGPNWRRGSADQRHRRADQHAGAERNH
jgi:methyl-accepting chemotaxis protein